MKMAFYTMGPIFANTIRKNKHVRVRELLAEDVHTHTCMFTHTLPFMELSADKQHCFTPHLFLSSPVGCST